MAELLHAIIGAGIHFAGNFGAVVAGEDDQGIVRDIVAFQRLQNLTDGPVGLMNKVPVRAGL